MQVLSRVIFWLSIFDISVWYILNKLSIRLITYMLSWVDKISYLI